MTELPRATLRTAAQDINAWLAALLSRHDGVQFPDEDIPALRARLRDIPFAAAVGALSEVDAARAPLVSVALYQHWIASQPMGAPHLFAAWFNLGVAFSQAGDRTRAGAAYQNALAARPDFHAAAANLGLVQESLGDTTAALDTWSQALQTNEARTTLLNSRGRLFEQLNRLDEAEAELRRSLMTDPNQPDVIQHWVYIRQKMCLWPVLTTEVPGLTPPDLLRNAGPLSVLALSDDIAVQRDTAAAWIERKTAATPHHLSPPEGYRHDRIRVGYLSSDFCRHAMSYLIAELFERHDRARFEIFGYCISNDDNSEIRGRIIRAFDHFRVLRTLDDAAAAQAIRDDEIDILIDLNGLTSGARPQIQRWKPAPVQAAYLGFIGPIPMPELDYLFCDPMVVPPDLAGAYQPAPLYIAPNYQANDSKRGIGAAATRTAAGLPEDKFIFCCFSNYYKITQEMFAAWMTILARTDNSVLWLSADNAPTQQRLSRTAATHGIAPERIIFAARVGPDEYMARLTLADLFLDTFPYNAGTIASDAIRMGLPLVTRVGWSFASRMAGRLLASVQALEGVASTQDAYIDFAVKMAADPLAWHTYRAQFGARAWAREIGDIAGFTASYEATLLTIAKRAPEATALAAE